MCFSATGSFIAAGINAAAGAATLHKTKGTPESVLAGFPFIFAAQQTIEGALWLALPAHAEMAGIWTANSFVLVALAVWPTLVPYAAHLLETNAQRRRALAGFIVVGVLFTLYALIEIVSHPFGARVVGHSIVYGNGREFPLVAAIIYCSCVSLPLLIATQRSLKLLGLCVMTGMIVSLAFYYVAFFSVWCLFAALASGLVFFRAYFELPRAAPRAI
jgi:hypothetical protein